MMQNNQLNASDVQCHGIQALSPSANMHVQYLVQANAVTAVSQVSLQPSNEPGAGAAVVASHGNDNCKAKQLSGEHLFHNSR